MPTESYCSCVHQIACLSEHRRADHMKRLERAPEPSTRPGISAWRRIDGAGSGLPPIVMSVVALPLRLGSDVTLFCKVQSPEQEGGQFLHRCLCSDQRGKWPTPSFLMSSVRVLLAPVGIRFLGMGPGKDGGLPRVFLCVHEAIGELGNKKPKFLCCQ